MDNIAAFLIGIWTTVLIFKIYNYFENKKILKELQDRQDKLYKKITDSYKNEINLTSKFCKN